MLARDVPWNLVPNYLTTVNVLKPSGNLVAEVVADLKAKRRERMHINFRKMAVSLLVVCSAVVGALLFTSGPSNTKILPKKETAQQYEVKPPVPEKAPDAPVADRPTPPSENQVVQLRCQGLFSKESLEKIHNFKLDPVAFSANNISAKLPRLRIEVIPRGGGSREDELASNVANGTFFCGMADRKSVLEADKPRLWIFSKRADKVRRATTYSTPDFSNFFGKDDSVFVISLDIVKSLQERDRLAVQEALKEEGYLPEN
ncbi:MAG: hypothetical protein JNM76_13235 [Betaproteobacteria bacterium]|nr:hypothetical protein [Betaproteobacteria bacterium]